MMALRHGGGQGLVQVMAAAALWATVGVASQLIPAERNLSEEMLGVARLALGGPVILLAAALIGRVSLADFRRLDPLRLGGFVLGSVVFQVCLFRAFTSLGVTVTVFLTVCLPPLLSCFWYGLRGQKVLSAGSELSLGLALAGLVVFGLSSGDLSAGAGVASAGAAGGLVLALLASAAFVLMTFCARDLTRSAGPLVVAGTGLTMAGLCLLLAVVALDPQSISLPDRGTGPLASLILYLVLGPTALAYVIYCTGMARCRSTNAGLIASMIEPGLAALLAWVLLGETLSAGAALGCALIATAMALLWRAEHPRQFA